MHNDYQYFKTYKYINPILFIPYLWFIESYHLFTTSYLVLCFWYVIIYHEDIPLSAYIGPLHSALGLHSILLYKSIFYVSIPL